MAAAPAAAKLDPRHVPALAEMAALYEARGHESFRNVFVEAKQAYGYHAATLRAMERLGYVKVAKHVQNCIHTPRIVYLAADLLPAGYEAYKAHQAAEAAEQIAAGSVPQYGPRKVEGCPLPGQICDPDVDHDHDPLPAWLAGFDQ